MSSSTDDCVIDMPHHRHHRKRNTESSYLRTLTLVMAIVVLLLAGAILVVVMSNSNTNYQAVMRAVAFRQYQAIPQTPAVETYPADYVKVLTDDGSASRVVMRPPRIISTQDASGRHHTTFRKVCLHKSEDDRKTVKFFNVDSTNRAQYDLDYWTVNSPHFRLYHMYLDEEQSMTWPLEGSTYLPGSTFLHILSQDNIAQFAQELTCHLPPLIDAQYRLNHSITGYDHFYTVHMNILDANETDTKRDWCESQLRLTSDTVADLQPGRPLDVVDHLRWHHEGRHENVCFDELTVYQPQPCGGMEWLRVADNTDPAVLPAYPASLKAAYDHHYGRVFEEQGLRTNISCVRNITVYDRADTKRRRLLNAPALVEYLNARAVEFGLDLNVRLLSKVEGNLFAQMHDMNTQDLWVESHSASNYNAPWLPRSGGAFVEVGQHGSWYAFGQARYQPQRYQKYDWGYELAEYDAKVDDQPFDGERSFSVSAELMKAIFNGTMYSEVSFCRL